MIEFWNDTRLHNCKNPAIAISGGADSAITLYLLAQQNIEAIRPYHLHNDTHAPKQIDAANDVVNFVRSATNVKIYDLEIKDITGPVESMIMPNFYMIEQMDATYNCDVYVSGSTANPPAKTLIKLGMDNEDRVLERDSYRKTLYTVDESADRLYYRPFANTNKKQLSKIYKTFKLEQTLFPLTLSCTQTFTRTPCNDCWWCKERAWGFNNEN